MATVSGACVISKVSGLLQIREDTAPSKLIWKAIDQDKSLEIPLNNLNKLQASPDTSPKMLLKLFYMEQGSPEVKDIKLTFNNRQTMNAVKETLQTIVARQKTVIKDSPATGNDSSASASGTPAPSTNSGGLSPAPGDPLDFSLRESLSDSALLKNRQLQQKLLLEDKTLRNVFTQSVIKFKLSPAIFWSSRVGQLRTYALTISQHRGPYNVLSTIKPVATSDNQVNVNVTRDTINEIFETYPIIRRAFNELVPLKLSEGEFWSRFFNSKLFRRLRGDKINTVNSRGDVVIDNYLYVDADFVEEEEKNKNKSTQSPTAESHPVNKFIDLLGNEVDNSQKLGLSPDFTMKFSDDDASRVGSQLRNEVRNHKNENEMVILMKNMNKLSNKMVTINSAPSQEQPNEKRIYEELENELDIADLNEAELLNYVELNLDTQGARHISQNLQESTPAVDAEENKNIESFLTSSLVLSSETGINLRETYLTKSDEITKANQHINGLVKHNFRIFKLLHNVKDPQTNGDNILAEEDVQELITFNITIIEFLLHFWNLFLNGGNPVQLRKLFTNLRNCQSSLSTLEKKLIDQILAHPQVQQNEKLREKLVKDLENCIFPVNSGLKKACNDYMTAVRAANEREESNENGKRPFPVELEVA